MKMTIPFTILLLATALATPTAGTHVRFDEAGVTLVDGKPFFPVGIYIYQLTPDIMADLKAKDFNTIVNISGDGFQIGQLDTIRDNGMMAVVPSSPDWVAAARNHSALLAWYLRDEPEGHGHSPEAVRERYLELKKDEPNHPIGLTHYLFESFGQYKDGCDYTMSDVYPVTAQRDVPLLNVGIHIDEAHRVHGGAGWPTWAWIQCFGGPQTDGGKWAVPRPDELRCMTYIALVHGATGILYFAYWPQAPEMWASVGPLNREINRLAPWLTAPGTDIPARSSQGAVQVRARKSVRGLLVIAVNTGGETVDADITLEGVQATALDLPFESRQVPLTGGGFHETFAPRTEHVYLLANPAAKAPSAGQ